MQPVEIEVLDNDFKPHKLLAYGITPTIAVHPRLSRFGILDHENPFTITHIPSGAKFNSILVNDDLDKDSAITLAEYIAGLIGEIENKSHKEVAKLMLEKCPNLKDLVRAKREELAA